MGDSHKVDEAENVCIIYVHISTPRGVLPAVVLRSTEALLLDLDKNSDVAGRTVPRISSRIDGEEKSLSPCLSQVQPGWGSIEARACETLARTPLPPPSATEEEEAGLFRDDAYIDGPIKVDYGTNLRSNSQRTSFGRGVYVNFNCTFLDTCLITIGSRTLIGPGCSFFAATHPLDPFLRNGINGPELGGPITIGEDCWFGGNVTVCPNVTIGRGCTIGAGSVVTKDVPAFHVVAGNPARIIKKIEPKEPDPALALSEGSEAIIAAAERN
ncbi:acetyltransferase [Drepanopeziza brunnea f. sp. 'multigermtubi' MB_m1]|uniref:Acetyltransferase n=1 Tax=Marssonina brunnea f. sp. multigermtubi (strain MB_m1) TaxID=1072389 RepID=K1XA62_MARBU|nr:acetyltransferase [Drepanopeziza brunnea f. sp. 'multigermtubi' MB_m1]EKD17603.1 acetyltransferase [Drepanopeziza brunnea f. sp. 'multigermtubi' MB_m1]